MADSTARDASRIEEIERVQEEDAGLDEEVWRCVIVEVCLFGRDSFLRLLGVLSVCRRAWAS